MNENWTKFIEMYLQGELSQEDTAKLQVELDRNPEMRQSLELQKKIHEAAKRNGERELVKTARKTYQLQRTVKTSVVSVIVATAIATLGYLAYQAFENKAMSETESSQAVTDGKYKELDNMAELENLPISYFEHNGNDATFLSPNGIMLSVPEKTFLLDGKTYDGNAIIQFQEAINASDIVKAGLSTTSGDRLLETQGMFQLKAFTPDGKRLTVNDKDGIYLQIPVDENKKGMMLFNGVKTADGSIDWQNPKPIEKLPIQANMLDLDLYPPGYEAKLDELKWKRAKKQRDSLYLSFEEVLQEKDTTTLPSNQIDIRCATSAQKVELKTNTFLLHNTENFQVYLKDKKMSIDRISRSDDETNLEYTTRNFYGISPVINIQKLSETKFKLIVGYLQDSDYSDDPRKTNSDFATINKNAETNMDDHFGFNIISGDAKIQLEKTMKRVNDRVPFYESTFILELPRNYNKEIEIEAKDVSRNIFAGGNKYFNIQFRNNKMEASVAQVAIQKNPLPPSKVLAIWKKEFNNTILATRDFEKRMKAIHETCNEKVFDVYANQLNKALWQLDEQVVKMGYADFQAFADERVESVQLDNAHMNTIRQFYESNVSRLKELAKKDKNFQKAIEMAWDSKVRNERNEEVARSAVRVQKVFQEEYNLNLDNVYKQLGKSKTVGVTIYGGGTIYNIDKYVRDATIARKSATITDPETGKTAKITYNPFSASIKNAKEYGKLFLYLLPHELTSFQRINPVSGKFDYSLNADIQYEIVFVGIKEDGYFISERKNLKGGNLGEIDLLLVSEKEFERKVEKLSKDRQKSSTKSSDMSNELSWLKLERQDYKEQKLRQKKAEFRRMMKLIVQPCACEGEYYPSNSDIEEITNPFY